MRIKTFALLTLAAALTLRPLPALAEEIPVDVKADRISYERGPDVVTLSGHVEVKVKGAVITGDEIIVDRKAQKVISEKPFRLVQKDDKGRDQVVEGTRFDYAIDIGRAEVHGARAVVPAGAPDAHAFVTADLLTIYDQGKRIVGQGAMFTTCDNITEGPHLETPGLGTVHYTVVATILDYIPDDRIIGWGTTINLVTAPVYWLPLFYAPLGKNDLQGLDVGQNLVEGAFIRSRLPMKYSDAHEGTIFAELMQNKGIGLGYQHDWVNPGFATPSDAPAWARPLLAPLGQPSQTYLFFHGIPVRGLTLVPPGLQLNTGETIGQAASADPALGTQQFQPGLPGIGLSPALAPSQRGELWRLGPVSLFEDYDFGLQHRHRLWPTADAEIGFFDRNYYNLSQFLGARDNDRLWRFDFKDSEIWNVADEALTLSTSGAWDNATRWDQNSSLRTNTTGTASNRKLQVSLKRGDTSLSVDNNWNVAQAPKPGTGPGLPGQPSQPTELIVQNDTLTSNWNLSQTLLPGLTWNNRVNFQQKSLPSVPTDRFADLNSDLTQSLDWGTVAARVYRKQVLNVGLSAEDAQKLQSQRGTIFEHLPEIDIRTKPIFDQIFPLTLSTVVGNYVETTPTTEVQAARAVVDVSAAQRPLDLGLGFKADFGGTGLKQSLYSTSDAQFSFTGKSSITNDLTSYFRPTLTYQKVVTGDEDPIPYKNNTPFSQDKTSFSKVDQITASIAAFNQPWLTTTFNGGYDFQNKSNMPLIAQLQSSGSSVAGLFDYQVTLQSGYQFRQFTTADVGRTVKSLTQEDITVEAGDVGRLLNFKGGQISNTVLGFQIQSAGGYGGDWGKESGIKQGGGLRLDTSWDFNKMRPQSLMSELSFSIGSSWWWHTELAVQSALELSGATQVGGLLPVPWMGDNNQPIGTFFPLNRIMLKKDLHDFIFTLSYDRFTQSFMANINLVAFPFGTDNLSGAFNQLSSGSIPTGF